MSGRGNGLSATEEEEEAAALAPVVVVAAVVVAETLIDVGHHHDDGVLNGFVSPVSRHRGVNLIPTFHPARAEVVDHQGRQAVLRREARPRLDHHLPVDDVVLAATLCLRIVETAGGRPDAVLLVP